MLDSAEVALEVTKSLLARCSRLRSGEEVEKHGMARDRACIDHYTVSISGSLRCRIEDALRDVLIEHGALTRQSLACCQVSGIRETTTL